MTVCAVACMQVVGEGDAWARRVLEALTLCRYKHHPFIDTTTGLVRNWNQYAVNSGTVYATTEECNAAELPYTPVAAPPPS